MANSQNSFISCELKTTDKTAAGEFCKGVIGWSMAGAARAEQGDGRGLQGPMQFAGGAWIAQCLDPKGALFAFTGPRG